MKTFKNKFLLPIAVFMVAVVAAFASQAPKENVVWEQGYIHSTIPCETSVLCSPSGDPVCKYGNKQVFGMNGASQCTRTLYLPYQ